MLSGPSRLTSRPLVPPYLKRRVPHRKARMTRGKNEVAEVAPASPKNRFALAASTATKQYFPSSPLNH